MKNKLLNSIWSFICDIKEAFHDIENLQMTNGKGKEYKK